VTGQKMLIRFLPQTSIDARPRLAPQNSALTIVSAAP